MFNTALSLICNPSAPVLDAGLGVIVEETLRAAGVEDFVQRVLADGVASDYLFEGYADPQPLRDLVVEALAGAPIDINVLRAEGREKRLLVADMDSTIIAQECLDEIADFAGLKAEISAITAHAMRGEMDFGAALTARVAMLRGVPERVLGQVFEERVTLTPGATRLTATMRARGGYCALVSGGFTYFTERVAALAGFDTHRANALIVEAGALTGRVALPILGADAKTAALVDLAGERGLSLSATLAVGDGANDLGMIARAGMGVAFHAKPAVAAAAAARIKHGDLTALLFLQGIAAADFAE